MSKTTNKSKRKFTLGEMATAIRFLQDTGMMSVEIDTVEKLLIFLEDNCDNEIRETYCC